jgi:hypothetical protein
MESSKWRTKRDKPDKQEKLNPTAMDSSNWRAKGDKQAKSGKSQDGRERFATLSQPSGTYSGDVEAKTPTSTAWK